MNQGLAKIMGFFSVLQWVERESFLSYPNRQPIVKEWGYFRKRRREARSKDIGRLGESAVQSAINSELIFRKFCIAFILIETKLRNKSWLLGCTFSLFE